MKDHVGNANPEPQPAHPANNTDGNGITINGINIKGGNVIIGNTAPIIINLLLPCPPIYSGKPANQPTLSIRRIITQKSRLALRQITRKFSVLAVKSRQISRNPKTTPNPPQPQSSRHFQPIPPKSLIPPNISLLHTRRFQLFILNCNRTHDLMRGRLGLTSQDSA